MSTTTTTYTGVRIADMPDLGIVTDASSFVGELAGSGRFSAPAMRAYALTTAPIAWLNGNNAFTGTQTITPVGTLNGDGTHKALDIEVNGAGINNAGGHFVLIDIKSDQVVSGALGFIDGMDVYHNCGGSTMTGGRQALVGQMAFQAPSSPANANRNYVGVTGTCFAYASDNGAPGAEAGAFFGMNSVVSLTSAAQNVLNASCCEFNVDCEAGSSVKHKTGIQIVAMATDVVRGSVTDAAIAISGEGGAGFTYGILFTDMSGHTPMRVGGTAMGFVGTGISLACGIDLADCTITGNIIQGTGGALSNTRMTLNGVQVVGTQRPGWAAVTNGSPVRGAFNIGAATTATNAQAIAAIITDLMAHGLLGA